MLNLIYFNNGILCRCPHKFSALEEHDINVSIIISYHNESLSTLLTTIYSIYGRTPLQYLQEIIIIDDYSEDGKLNVKKNIEQSINPSIKFVKDLIKTKQLKIL